MIIHWSAWWCHIWRPSDMSNFCKLVSLWLCMYVIRRHVTSFRCQNACLQLKAGVAYCSLVLFRFSYALFCFACFVFVTCVLHMRPNKPHCYNKPGVRRYCDLHVALSHQHQHHINSTTPLLTWKLLDVHPRMRCFLYLMKYQFRGAVMPAVVPDHLTVTYRLINITYWLYCHYNHVEYQLNIVK